MERDDNVFDSDGENMSLAVTMKLANELSLLKSFLDIYKKFSIHHAVGDVAGSRYPNSSQVCRRYGHSRENDAGQTELVEVDPWEPNDISVLGEDTKEARDERMRSLKERVRAGISFTGACGGEGYIQE